MTSQTRAATRALSIALLLLLTRASAVRADSSSYPNGARLQDSLGYVYYPSGARLRDSLGYIYYPDGSRLKDSLGYYYYPGGARLKDSLGYLYYPNGARLKDSLGYMYYNDGTRARDSLGNTYYDNGSRAGGPVTLRAPLGKGYGFLKVRVTAQSFQAVIVLDLGYDRTFNIDVGSGEWWLE